MSAEAVHVSDDLEDDDDPADTLPGPRVRAANAIVAFLPSAISQLCWLALLLIRVAENSTADTFRGRSRSRWSWRPRTASRRVSGGPRVRVASSWRVMLWAVLVGSKFLVLKVIDLCAGTGLVSAHSSR